jgi:hypothetical protein
MPRLNYVKIQRFEGSSMQSLNYPEKTRCPRSKCEDSNVSTMRTLKLIMRRLKCEKRSMRRLKLIMRRFKYMNYAKIILGANWA